MVEFRGIVRIAGKDLDGNLSLPKALVKIKGIGANLADSIAVISAKELGVEKNAKIGNLSEAQAKKLEKIVLDPVAHGIPGWMVNRQRDVEGGKGKHLVASDLVFQVKRDIDAEKGIKSRRGIRHALGLPVRGQRTKTMGRKGMTLGVMKKKKMPTKAKKK